MPRPKQYGSPAEKQAAYRDRLTRTTALVDRAALDRLHERLDSLQVALRRAALTGDTLAHNLRAASTDTMLDKLIALFEERGNPPKTEPGAQPKLPSKKAKKEPRRVR